MRYPTNNPIRGQRWYTRKPDKTFKFSMKSSALKNIDVFCNEKKENKKPEENNSR